MGTGLSVYVQLGTGKRGWVRGFWEGKRGRDWIKFRHVFVVVPAPIPAGGLNLVLIPVPIKDGDFYLTRGGDSAGTGIPAPLPSVPKYFLLL